MVFRTTKAPHSPIPFPSEESSDASRQGFRVGLVAVLVALLALAGLIFWLTVLR